MSDDKIYVDPSSGAAPQPGAVYPGAFETDDEGQAKLKDVPLNELRQPNQDGEQEAATATAKEEAPKKEAPKEEAKPAATKEAKASKDGGKS